MRSVVVVGGGLAGLATAAALGGSGYRVRVLESRAFLGGRATSYAVPAGDGAFETIDNCQHVLLRCCVNLLDFYERLGASRQIEFHKTFHFIEPGGRRSTLAAGVLPAPAHFTGSFVKLRFLSLADKLSVARGLLALRRERTRRGDLDRITMLDWLREKRQTRGAINRFWGPVLVSAINEELDRMAASHGFQVFWLGFLASSDGYEMGLSAVPLAELYGSGGWSRIPAVELCARMAATGLITEGGRATGVSTEAGVCPADYVVLAVPFERLPGIAPELGVDVSSFEHSPITGIHLWFDRPITDLPHAALLDRTIQWMFNKGDGRYVQLVVSASRGLTAMARQDVIDLVVRELREFFPAAREAELLKAHVVKEVRATFAAAPGLEARRPGAKTSFPNVFLAGDWTRSGWPATMEGAVRSGYIAAEAVAAAAGLPERFLLPDIA